MYERLGVAVADTYGGGGVRDHDRGWVGGGIRYVCTEAVTADDEGVGSLRRGRRRVAAAANAVRHQH